MIRLANNHNLLKKLKTEIDAFKNHSFYGRSPAYQHCIQVWEDIYSALSKSDDSHITLNNIRMFDTLSYHEALFLMLGLPTSFLIKYSGFDIYKPVSKCPDHHIRTVFEHSIENQALSRTTFRKPDNSMLTSLFTNWGHEANFFLSDSQISEQETKTSKPRSQKVIEQQKKINLLARTAMYDYPKHTRESLSIDLANLDDISLSSETIRREYLSGFPEFL